MSWKKLLGIGREEAPPPAPEPGKGPLTQEEIEFLKQIVRNEGFMSVLRKVLRYEAIAQDEYTRSQLLTGTHENATKSAAAAEAFQSIPAVLVQHTNLKPKG